MNNAKAIRKLTTILLLVVAVICIARWLYLPALLQQHLKKSMHNPEGFEVMYSDFSISVLSRSFVLMDVKIRKEGHELPLPFFTAEEIVFTFQRDHLINGRLATEITVNRPTLNFINGPNFASSQKEITSEWLSSIKEISIAPVNVLHVRNGRIHYRDLHSTPPVLLSMTDVNITGKNLHNPKGKEKFLSGIVEGSARVENARIKINLELNPVHSSTMFLLTAELTDLDLFLLKDFLEAYNGVAPEQGMFSLYTHASTRNNRIVGFVQPEVEPVNMAYLPYGNPGSPVNYGLNTDLLKINYSRKLNEIQFENDLRNPEPNLWNAVAITLHNAFIQGLNTILDTSPGEISPNPHLEPKRHKSKVSRVKNVI